MFTFRKKSTNAASRARRPVVSDGTGPPAVFSYHASRSTRTDGASGRIADKLPWINASKPSVQRQSRPWVTRARAVAIAVLLVLFVTNSLILSREPNVVALAEAPSRQVFLQDQAVYQRAAQAALAGSVTSTNKVTINTDRIAAALLQQFPELEHVSVSLPVFGRRPTVYIQPAQPALLLRTADAKLFILDDAGRAVMSAARVHKVEKLGLTVVEDQSELPVTIGQTTLPASNMAFITEVIGQLKAKKVVISSVVLPKGTSQLDVRVQDAPYIVKFNLRGDARAEAGAYLATKQHLEREHKTPASYIDVRVDNRVYYK